MLALQVLAAIMLFLSAACFFGPQLVIYGPHSFSKMFKQRQVKLLGGALVTACVFAVAVPHFVNSVPYSGEYLSPAALEVMAASFGAA